MLYADGDADYNGAPADTLDFTDLAVACEGRIQFATSPFSIFAVYEGSRTSADRLLVSVAPEPTRLTDNRVMGGIRLYLNENTLQFNDRNGTTLDIIAPFSAPSFIFASGDSEHST